MDTSSHFNPRRIAAIGSIVFACSRSAFSCRVLSNQLPSFAATSCATVGWLTRCASAAMAPQRSRAAERAAERDQGVQMESRVQAMQIETAAVAGTGAVSSYPLAMPCHVIGYIAQGNSTLRQTAVIRMALPTTERLVWHCGEHTAKSESASRCRFLMARICAVLLLRVELSCTAPGSRSLF